MTWDPTFYSDLSKISSTRKMLFYGIWVIYVSYTKKNRKFMLIKILWALTLKNRDLGQPIHLKKILGGMENISVLEYRASSGRVPPEKVFSNLWCFNRCVSGAWWHLVTFGPEFKVMNDGFHIIFHRSTAWRSKLSIVNFYVSFWHLV